MKQITVIILIFTLAFFLGMEIDTAKNEIEAQQERVFTLENKLDNIEPEIVINTNKKEVNYMRGTATAYTPTEKGINSDNNPEVTATGKSAKEGVIAVNPEIIPYGSEVMIIHEGTIIRGQAQDTGGAMRQNKNQVDILMENGDKAREWGRKEVHIIWW